MKALEIEDPEVENLVTESNGNGRKAANGSSAKRERGSSAYKYIGGATLALVFLLVFLGNSGKAVTSGDISAGSVVSKLDGNASDTLVDLNNPAAQKSPNKSPSSQESANNNNNDSNNNNGSENKERTTSATDTSASATDKGEAFMYSKFATIVPDPDQRLPPDDVRKELAEKHGKWRFWDGDEALRPKMGDYLAKYPNRDIPTNDFPDNAWQVDAVYVNHLINDGELLVQRAMEAIFAEYGHAAPLPPEQLAERMKMFKWDFVDKITDPDFTEEDMPIKYSEKRGRSGNKGGGGWTTRRSYDGLVRRILHAIMTNDEFVVVLGGHSAAAGHGNHFHQSYMMQMHKICAPIFARLGVKLVTRNMSQGGLGTLQNSMGSGSLYGDDVDLMIWDSGMTEGNGGHIEFFMRQALLQPNKVPAIWGAPNHIMRFLHNEVDADVGVLGTGLDGVAYAETVEENKALPYAIQCLKYSRDLLPLCWNNRYCAKCWIDRDDVATADGKPPFEFISAKHPGQAKWHPGWREHQLTGRVLAFSLLDALQSAIQIFSDGTMGGPPLDEDAWHVTDYYNNIRNKVKQLRPDQGLCPEMASGDNPAFPSTRFCNVALHGASHHTPRHNPEKTAIASMVKAAPSGYVPSNPNKNVYDGPDVHNTCYDIPKGHVNVLAIVSNRRRRQLQSQIQQSSLEERSVALDFSSSNVVSEHAENEIDLTLDRNATKASITTQRHLADAIVPGEGWEVFGEPSGQCDGEYNSYCAREYTNKCPLLGHHDARGELTGNEYAGWLVMTIPKVKEGIIALRFITWHDEKANPRTLDWTSVNNVRDGRRKYKKQRRLRHTSQRKLSLDDVNESTFAFDYAINGKITSLNKKQFKKQLKAPQRLFELLTVMDNPNFTDTPVDVEVAIRMRGCGKVCTFGLTHVYWA